METLEKLDLLIYEAFLMESLNLPNIVWGYSFWKHSRVFYLESNLRLCMVNTVVED